MHAFSTRYITMWFYNLLKKRTNKTQIVKYVSFGIKEALLEPFYLQTLHKQHNTLVEARTIASSIFLYSISAILHLFAWKEKFH